MKTAKVKFLSALAILLFTGATMNAQGRGTELVKDNYDEGFRLGFGISPGYMLEDQSNNFGNLALGVDVRLQYDLSRRTSLTLTTGYQHFFREDATIAIGNQIIAVKVKDVGIIPVKAGFKAFFWEDQFYGLGEAGVGFTVSEAGSGSNDTNIIISPGIGWASKYIDLSLRYEHYTEFETGQVALRLAYGFRL